MPHVPEVPTVPGELVEPLRALAQSAFMFRGVFIQVAEGRAVAQIVDERGDALELASAVLDAWAAALGIDPQGLGAG